MFGRAVVSKIVGVSVILACFEVHVAIGFVKARIIAANHRSKGIPDRTSRVVIMEGNVPFLAERVSAGLHFEYALRNSTTAAIVTILGKLKTEETSPAPANMPRLNPI